MEAEAETLRKMQAGLDHASGGTAQSSTPSASTNGAASTEGGAEEGKEGEASVEDSADIDARSIYVGNVSSYSYQV